MTRITVALALLVAFASTQPAIAQSQCKPVVGHFEAHVVPPADCPSPFCTAGRVWGGIQGDYSFVMTSLVPSGAVPSISFFTGQSDIALRSGDAVHGTDTGTLDLGPDGGFASLITFSGGTSAMTGASGQIRLRGFLDQAAGTTSGDYLGTLCTP